MLPIREILNRFAVPLIAAGKKVASEKERSLQMKSSYCIRDKSHLSVFEPQLELYISINSWF